MPLVVAVVIEEMEMPDIPAEFRLPFAAVLIGFALIFCVVAYLHTTPSLAMCAGICVISAGRIVYAVAREQGLFLR